MAEEKYEPSMIQESCPYCGEMTDMTFEDGVWISGTCKCGKKIDGKSLGILEVVEEKPDLKAGPDVLP